MCNIRTHEDVSSWEDVQDVITSVVIRQCGGFSKKVIFDQSKEELSGAAYNVNNKDLEKYITNTLGALMNSQSVLRKKGKYKIAFVA